MRYINGFSVGQDDLIGTFSVPGSGVQLPVRREIAPLLLGLAREFNTKIETLHEGWCWGYDNRPVTSGSTPSFHAAGIAIDLNAPDHPRGVRNTFSPRQVALIRPLAKKYGARWGGDYVNSPKDDMHFEIIVPRSRALVMVAALQTPSTVQPPHGDLGPTGPFLLPEGHWYAVNDHTVHSHSGVNLKDRPAIKSIQREVGVKADGFFGPNTEHYVKHWQHAYGQVEDGLVGVHTWNSMRSH